MSVLVRLTEIEVLGLVNEVSRRTIYRRFNDTPQTYGAQGFGLDLDVVGGLGEYAYCKWRGLPWSATPGLTDRAGDVPGFTDRHGDVGDGRQIRATTHQNGHLLIHREDNPEHNFLLVVVGLPVCRLVGWINGAAAQQAKYWDDRIRTRTGAYMVPQSDLHPLVEKVKV